VDFAAWIMQRFMQQQQFMQPFMQQTPFMQQKKMRRAILGDAPKSFADFSPGYGRLVSRGWD
jgi:hypothetical protein